MHSANSPAAAPAPVQRPAFAGWLFERGLRNSDAAEVCGVGREQVRRYCLPFGDPMRVVPPEKVIERIVTWTKGAVTAADFYPPRIAGRGGDGAGEGASQ